jgi:2-polyprenyl-6-methoxyphenol hydroxylase-like FAD-dependent oxidoreductase
LYLDHGGEIIDREDYTQFMTSWDLLYHIGRANFDGQKSGHLAAQWDDVLAGTHGETLRESWGRAKYEYGKQVEKLQVQKGTKGDRVEIWWKDTMEGSPNQGEIETTYADYVICADGPSSKMRGMLLGQDEERKYAGYVAFRGTVPEHELSKDTKAVFVEKFTFFHGKATQILGYAIPGAEGALEPGKRLVNWVWYWNFEEGSKEHQEVFTDSDGNRHRFTLPTGGKMRKDVWDRQVRSAEKILPPQFLELVKKTQKPFVQAITDVEPPAQETKVGALLEGKVALLGDALAGFRPHTAASTSQAAFDALRLEEVFAGRLSWDDYHQEVMSFARVWQKRGVMQGNRSQFEEGYGGTRLNVMARD